MYKFIQYSTVTTFICSHNFRAFCCAFIYYFTGMEQSTDSTFRNSSSTHLGQDLIASLRELQLRASGGRKTQGRGQEQRVKRARVGISEPPPTPHPFPHLSSCGSSEHVKIN